MYKVMIVDDEMYVRNGMAEQIDWKSLNCTVCSMAENGLDALAKYEAERPDLIISDIRMPKCDGIDLLQRLRDNGENVQVIFLTAYDEFNYARDALRLLAADYILKPFEDGELEDSVRRILPKLIQNPSEEENLADSNRFVRETISYIEEQYSSPQLSIATIADNLRISQGYISRLFKKEMNMTIAAYITQVRMKKAALLLKNRQNYKVYEVCEMCGYSDVAYFSSLFRKIYQMTPTEFQNQDCTKV